MKDLRDAIEEYVKIHKEIYGEDLSKNNAYDLAQNLLNVYKIVYKIPGRPGFVLNKGQETPNDGLEDWLKITK